MDEFGKGPCISFWSVSRAYFLYANPTKVRTIAIAAPAPIRANFKYGLSRFPDALRVDADLEGSFIRTGKSVA